MQTVTLGRRAAITTTQLGFGTAGLLREPSKRRRLSILAAALDVGIRHFDTAPLYGLGEAERVLGEFLATRTETVTIATKFGLMPNAAAKRVAPLQAVARTVVRAFPGLHRLARRSAARLRSATQFDAATARASLESSLAALRRDRIDVFLLHECVPAAMQDASLPAALEDFCDRTRIGTFGTATTFEHTVAMLAAQRVYCDVVQFDSNAVTQNVLRLPPATAAGLITHGVLTPSRAEIAKTLRTDAELRRQWTTALEADIAAPQVLSRLLLQAAVEANRHGVTLVHSNSTHHIAANAAALETRADPLQLAELARLLRARFTPPTPTRLQLGAGSRAPAE